jgi:hypothetical protein
MPDAASSRSKLSSSADQIFRRDWRIAWADNANPNDETIIFDVGTQFSESRMEDHRCRPWDVARAQLFSLSEL